MSNYVVNKKLLDGGRYSFGLGGYLQNLNTQARPSFHLPMKPSLTNLSDTINLNGTAVAASVVMESSDISGTSWAPQTGAETLNSSSANTTGRFGPVKENVCNVLSAFTSAATKTMGNVGTDDFVMEFIIRPDTSSSADSTMVDKFTADTGWRLDINTSSSLNFLMGSAGPVTATVGVSVSRNCWNHVLIVCDRSQTNGLRMYVNGSNAATSASTVTDVGALSESTLGLKLLSNNAKEFGIARLAIWNAASWLDTSDQAAFALSRFLMLIGMNYAGSTPTISCGDGGTCTNLETSTGKKYVCHVGADWPAMRIVDDKGYLATKDASVNNRPSVPVLLDGWSVNGTSISASAVRGPMGASYFDGTTAEEGCYEYVASVGTGTRNIFVAATGMSGSSTGSYSMFVKRGVARYVYFFCGSAAFAGRESYFDLENGTMEQAGTGMSARIEDWGDINGDGDKWYRLVVAIGASVGSGAGVFLGACDAVGSTSYSGGDGSSVTFYAQGPVQAQTTPTDFDPQHHLLSGSRGSDSVAYSLTEGRTGNIGSGKGAMWYEYLTGNYDHKTDFNTWEIDDVSVATSEIKASVLASSDLHTVVTAIAAGDTGTVTSTTSAATDAAQEIHVSWTEDNLRFQLNDNNEAQDTSVDIPTSLDRLKLFRGVHNVRLFKVPQV